MSERTAMEAYFEIALEGDKMPVALPAENVDEIGLVTLPVPVEGEKINDLAYSPIASDRALAAVQATRHAAQNLQVHTGLRVAVPYW